MPTRIETDSRGHIAVDSSRYQCAQTQRLLVHFAIRDNRFSRHFIESLGLVKKAAAVTNHSLDLPVGTRIQMMRSAWWATSYASRDCLL